jgi:hypothetical protein
MATASAPASPSTKIGKLAASFQNAGERYPWLRHGIVRLHDNRWPIVKHKRKDRSLGLPTFQLGGILTRIVGFRGRILQPSDVSALLVHGEPVLGVYFSLEEVSIPELANASRDFQEIATEAARLQGFTERPASGIGRYPLADDWLEWAYDQGAAESPRKELKGIWVPGGYRGKQKQLDGWGRTLGVGCLFDTAAELLNVARDLTVPSMDTVSVSRVAAHDSIDPQKESGSKTESHRGLQKLTVDEKMVLKLLAHREKCQGWTAEQWKEAVGCSKTSIINAPTWKNLMMMRADAKESRRNR